MLQYGEHKMIVYESTLPSVDSFTVEQPINWQKCRETFYDKFTPEMIGFFFSHDPAPEVPDNIYAFILKTEALLRIGGATIEPTVFSHTNRNYAIWVQPSSFWKECRFRRSLFTILLRCGARYYGDNYEQALYSNKYIIDTCAAVKRFLFGFIQINDKIETKGWVNTFTNKSTEEVKILLTKPQVIDEANFYGVGSIWS